MNITSEVIDFLINGMEPDEHLDPDIQVYATGGSYDVTYKGKRIAWFHYITHLNEFLDTYYTVTIKEETE